MYRVCMQLGGKPVRKFTFDKESVTIGRDPTCDIVIENIGASRQHAVIERTDAGYMLADLKSHNGTFVEGEKVLNHRLRENDEFLIGKYTFQFEEIEPVVDRDSIDAGLAAAPGGGPGAADMTFRLERSDIQKILEHSARSKVSQLIQLKPEKQKRSVLLEGSHYVIGKDPSAEIRTKGFRMPAKAIILIAVDRRWHALCIAKSAQINGVHVPEATLHDGDLVSIRGLRFRFCQA